MDKQFSEKKILLVEDEIPLHNTLKTALQDKGYQVVGALDGETGFALAKKEQPALILLDLILPRLSGFEVLEKLKRDPDTKDIPVIVLTNLEGATEVDRALELGARTYLVKANYGLSDVVEKIETTLKGFSA